MQKRKFPLIGNIKRNRLTNEQIQSEINQESANYSPKYIRNIYGLLTAALEMFAPNFPVHVSYPENRQKEIVMPSAKKISLILQRCKDDDLSLAIMLAAYLGLRMGEISGLKVSDIDLQKNTIHICRSVVLSAEKEWIEKVPKTKSGRRTLSIPDILRDTLEYAVKGKTQTDAVVALSPSQISDNFQTLAKKADIPQVTFHALRHYNASFMLARAVSQINMRCSVWDTLQKICCNEFTSILYQKKNKRLQTKSINIFPILSLNKSCIIVVLRVILLAFLFFSCMLYNHHRKQKNL